jgi:hypothetical protein
MLDEDGTTHQAGDSGQTERGDADANPFAPPAADLPEAIAWAWSKYAVVAGGLFAAILVGDLSFALGFTWLGVLSVSARMVLVVNGTGCAILATLQFALGRRDGAREWFATGIVFGGVALASVPPLLLLDWLLDLK